MHEQSPGNLDSQNGETVMGLMRELHEAGSTIVMVTHDPRYARHASRNIQLFEEVLRRDGLLQKYLKRLGDALEKAGDVEKARQTWERATQLPPTANVKAIHGRLVDYYNEHQQPERARRYRHADRHALGSFRVAGDG